MKLTLDYILIPVTHFQEGRCSYLRKMWGDTDLGWAAYGRYIALLELIGGSDMAVLKYNKSNKIARMILADQVDLDLKSLDQFLNNLSECNLIQFSDKNNITERKIYEKCDYMIELRKKDAERKAKSDNAKNNPSRGKESGESEFPDGKDEFPDGNKTNPNGSQEEISLKGHNIKGKERKGQTEKIAREFSNSDLRDLEKQTKQNLAEGKPNQTSEDFEKEKIFAQKEKDLRDPDGWQPDIPTLEHFIAYGEQMASKMGMDPTLYKNSLIAKYESWKQKNWRNGYNKPITNWQSSLANTMQYLQPVGTSGNINNRNGREDQAEKAINNLREMGVEDKEVELVPRSKRDSKK